MIKFYFVFVLSILSATESWKLVKTTGTVKAYTADIGKPFKKVKINSTVNTSYTKAFSSYAIYSEHKNWMPEILESELLKKESDSVWYVRYLVRFPFPFKNKDLVYKMKKKTLANEIRIEYVSAPSYIPIRTGVERMQISEGYWKFSKVNETTSEVETCGYNEAAGIPGWLVNMFIIDVPIKTVEKFIQRAK